VKKVLLTRYGGMGDLAPLTVVGKQLKKQGYHVTLACRDGGEAQRHTEMFVGNPSFDALLDLKMVGPWGTRCIKSQLGWCSVNSIYSDFDLVLDYMNIVESNNTSPVVKDGPGEAWQNSRSSNWRNWYDLHLEWANIDPTKVSDEDKRPVYTLLPGEEKLFEKLKQTFSNVFVVQCSASSLSRTWYQAKHLPELLLKQYPKAVVAYWDNKANCWVMISEKGASRLDVPGISPLRMSMALVAQADVFIGADSGFSHVAEGLGVKHIAIYSTVPWWTRAKYYKHQTVIDPGMNNPEFYTFNLGLGDPLRTQEGLASLSERERQVDALYEAGKDVTEAAEILNTEPDGARLELQALMAKKAAWERQQSKALSTVKPEMVMEKVKVLCQ
jgi:hypothetical protein